jgi:predicted deacylase
MCGRTSQGHKRIEKSGCSCKSGRIPSLSLQIMISTDIPIEVGKPDVVRYRNGSHGVPYLFSYESPNPGPHVMICALTHGNEYCGAIVLDRLIQIGLRPLRGKISLCFANVAAFERFDPRSPFQSRYVDEDFNRVWDATLLDSDRSSSELHRARELRPILETVDYLLDIHSIDAPHPPVMLTGMQPRSVRLAQEMRIPAVLVKDRGHADGVRLRDFGEFQMPDSSRTALLVECGQHWALRTLQTAWRSTWAFLHALSMVDAQMSDPFLGNFRSESTTVIEITEAVVSQSQDVRFSPGLSGLSVVADAGSVIGWNGPEEIVTPYDNCHLIMPRLFNAQRGITAVRFGREVPFRV